LIEIRTIDEREAPAFLRLICDIFELDFSRAESVFFTEPYFDLNRKWALFENERMVSILTTSPLKFGWGPACGIAAVATHPDHRRKGHARHLLQHVAENSDQHGEPAQLLFAASADLYIQSGFEAIDFVTKGPIRSEPFVGPGAILDLGAVRSLYDSWAQLDPNRLVRDDQRWKAWNFLVRTCEAAGNGYICHEAAQVREAVLDEKLRSWPVAPGAEWVGLESLTAQLGVPLLSSERTLVLMGRNVTRPAHLFLTDQF